MDLRISLCAQRGHSKRHRDAMIVAGIDLRAVQRLPAGHVQPIVEFLDLRSHGAKILCHQRNPVGFLHP